MTDGPSEVLAVSGEIVSGDPYHEFVVAADGAILPITLWSLDVARSQEWGFIGDGRDFKEVYYSALREAGVLKDQVQDDLRLLFSNRLPLKLTKVQCRVAYGLTKEVLWKNGQFKRGKLNGTDWETKLLQERARLADKPVISRFDVSEWSRIETDALSACSGLPDQVDIAVEFRWIRSNLHQTPYFKDAPSQGAIKDWLTIMGKDVSPMMREFTSVAWSKRLSPGDRKSKGKSAFVEDSVGEESDDRAGEDAEAYKRLFGDKA